MFCWMVGNSGSIELLKAMDINIVVQKAAANLKPEVTIHQEGDNFQIITRSAMKTTNMKFKVGEELTHKHPLKDENLKLLTTWEGNALVQKCVDNDANPIMTRTIVDGKMIVKRKLGDITEFAICYV